MAHLVTFLATQRRSDNTTPRQPQASERTQEGGVGGWQERKEWVTLSSPLLIILHHHHHYSK